MNDSHTEVNCEMAESEAVMLANYVEPTVATVGGNGWQGRLVEHDGSAYFAGDTADAAAKAALGDWFGGAATGVGCNGCSFDFSAAGAGYAVHPVNAMHNAGFLRDEGAVLLVFLLSDEGSESPEGVAAYREMLVDAKAVCGGDDCIVAGGLLSEWCDTEGTNFNLDFLSSFAAPPVLGSIGSINPFDPPPDYSETVGAALAQVVVETCQQIEPEG